MSDPERRSRRRWIVLGVLAFLGILVGGAALWEMQASWLQARLLVPVASEITWWVEEGPADHPLPAPAGPYDLRLGYTDLPDRIDRVRDRGFRIVHQARVSERSRSVVRDWDLFPIYRPKATAGLSIFDRDGEFLYTHLRPERIWATFEEIPPVVWQTLLFIENRTALEPDRPWRNPAVEWGRLFRSTTELGLRYLGSDRSVAGASTLATQMEKFRHAPEGRTESPRDKLIQMASASLRAYMDGPRTLDHRKRVVRDYLNSVPLAAARIEGEVNGLGDGLHAWFGADFSEVTQTLRLVPVHRIGAIPSPSELGIPVEDRPVPETAPAHYRRVLGLLLSQRRPTYYLTTPEGREALHRLTDQYLTLLGNEGLIAPAFADAARGVAVEIRPIPPERPPVSFVERKAVNTVRTGLLGLLGVPRLYDLDRLDLTVRSSIDAVAQRAATELIRGLHDPAFIAERGFDGFRLLDQGDPTQVIYSISLHERTDQGNLVRLQVDNLDAPFNLNESARLELGSTAKLRTLASYLEIVAELHERFGALDPDSLRSFRIGTPDRLSAWTRDRVLQRPDESGEDLLRAAMQRTYSASPAERFATGGGVQTFTNFDNTYDQQALTVTEGFRHSVNLVFIRMMRDVVNHYMYRVPGSTAHVLDERDTPLRQEYLERFADREGIQFLDQFIPKFRERGRGEILDALLRDRGLAPQRMAWAYRTAVPDGSADELGRLLRELRPDDEIPDSNVRELWERADTEPHGLADLGYLASVHPLELWAARYYLENPDATRTDAIAASEEARQEVYRWLFRTSRTSAQDQRIRSLLEVEAFTEVLRGWQRLGYPFGNIVPSLGTSIGSSGDRPAALNELVGIVLNEGLRLPTYRVRSLHMAPGTPWETLMEREGVPGERVMDPAVARVLREAMVDVVDEGTARRARATVVVDGVPVPIGGKTGTGDNRYRVYGPGGRLLESRSVNRTSTFVFFIGDRFFGVISAYVPGPEADGYRFTSALPTQILRELGPVIRDLVEAGRPFMESAQTGT